MKAWIDAVLEVFALAVLFVVELFTSEPRRPA